MRALLLALLVAFPAQAGSVVGILYDPANGHILMVTVPDQDSELDDPAYNPKGAVQLRVPLATFLATKPSTLQTLVPVPYIAGPDILHDKTVKPFVKLP